MCAAIRHRGPDDEGVHADAGVGLGMRRLSIIDLATGHQPIHNEDRTVWVVFNGEIYNYAALRRELESRGHRFYTSSDTETIVHAYEEWGEGAFVRLRGMFAIAVWDSRAATLLLARDRVGIKPLHYACRPERLYFGSEIKAILAVLEEGPALDVEALDHYLSYLYTPRDGSIFRAVRKLPPGHLLRWQNGSAQVRPFWAVSADEVIPASDEEASEQLRTVLDDAVRSHLMSDVPLGAFLSGGVDSSVVVGLMARATSRPVKTFSIGFDDPQFDELAACPGRRSALRDRPPRVRGQTGRAGHHRRPGLAFRRAIRRLVGNPDLVCVAAGAAAMSPSCCQATAATNCSAATITTFRIRESLRSIAGRLQGRRRSRR